MLSIAGGSDPQFETCPKCGATGKLRSGDGDTVYSSNAMASACRVAGGLALSRDGCSFCVHVFKMFCDACNAKLYATDVALIQLPEVTADWAHQYLWRNSEFDEAAHVAMLDPVIEGLPSRWAVFRTETPIGLLERHVLGPFVRRGSMQQEASDLFDRLWPVLANSGGGS